MFQAFVQNQTRFVVAPCAPQFSVSSAAPGTEVRLGVDVVVREHVAARQVEAPRAEDDLLAALEDVGLRAADQPRRTPLAGRVPLTLST